MVRALLQTNKQFTAIVVTLHYLCTGTSKELLRGTVYFVLRLKVFCGELSTRLKYFHLYSKYITLTVFLPRFWHYNLHSQNRLSYLQLSQNECFLWRMRCYVRYSASCQRMICTTSLACIIKLLVSRDTGRRSFIQAENCGCVAGDWSAGVSVR